MPPPSTTHPHDKAAPFTGLVTIVLTLAAWTVTPLLINEFVEDVDPWTSNGWRYTFAAILWLPLLLAKLVRKTLRPGIYRAALIPAAINAAGQVVFTMSFYYIDPGLVAFGLRMQIVAVTIGAAIMFPAERRVIRSRWFILGIALVLGGTLITVTQTSGSDDASAGDAQLIGVILAMAAGTGYAGYALAVRRCMAGYGPMESFSVISQYTAATMLILMLIFADRMGLTALDMPPARFGLFLLSAVIGIAAGHVLYYVSIARLGVAVSTGVVQLQPFTVGVLSMIITGEVLLLGQWISGTVAVAGAMLMIGVQHTIQRKARRTARLAHEQALHRMKSDDDAGASVPPSAALLEPSLSADVPALEQ